MKRLGRVLAFVLSICMVSCTFISCASPAKEEAGPVTITIWHDKEEDVAAVLQAKLNTLAPDIVVNLVRKDGMTEALKLVGNDPSAAPDMYWFAHDKIGLYAELGLLSPITDFISEEELSNYLDVTLSAATYKGTIYQLPLYYETLLFMYNKADMSEEEVPATSEELYAYMQTNTADGRYGFVEQYGTPYYTVPWIHGFGGYLLSEDGTPGLDDANTIAALEYHLKFLDYMPDDSSSGTVNTLFLEGMADSIIAGPWLVPTAREAGIDLGFAALPTVDETGLPMSPYIGVQGLHVLKVAGETKADAITTVLKALMQPEVGIELANASGCAPANELCYEDESVATDEMVMTMKDIAESAVAIPNRPEMDVIWTIAGNLLVAVNVNGDDPATEAAANQEKALKLIEAMK